ncbi:lantibiotic dehydratase C-terminal domain-containing protein [Streptomyces sp. NPDC050617]|uniref:lantibiotic dehydratase C-terminal domain-containing protein n=1 Tax=Streptomyces sp. NPDC050617 TaxID=3154628 RepID=UPI00341A0BFB
MTESVETQIPGGRPIPGTEAGEWQALHIFYTGSTRPILTQAIRPLLDRLTEEGLVSGYFFLNYWLEGPHIRVRFKPVSKAAEAEVRARAEEAVGAFLRERPALYEVKSDFYRELYNSLFDLEFSDEDRKPYLGEDGRMRLRPINTFSWEPYAPEYGKYGGPAGVELAEWHFKHSADLVMDAMRTTNVHVRTVLFGFASQLMMVMTTGFLRERDAMADYLWRYHQFWYRSFSGTDLISGGVYDRTYESVAESVRGRFDTVRGAYDAGATDRLPGFMRTWAEHCAELREKAVALAVNGDLTFRAWGGERQETVTDPDQALQILLSPYMHMTNNRLHVTIRDEAYLSYVLARSLRDTAPQPEFGPPHGSGSPRDFGAPQDSEPPRDTAEAAS